MVVTWFSEVLIELVVVYMVSIIILHVNCINMLSSPGFDVTSFTQILGQSANVAFNPVNAQVCPTSQVLCNLKNLSCCLDSEFQFVLWVCACDAPHVLHPKVANLLGLSIWGWGAKSFPLKTCSLMFLYLLYPTTNPSPKISFIWWSIVKVLACLCTISLTFGSLGSYVVTKAVFLSSLFSTFFRVSSLVKLLNFMKAASITFFLYFLARSMVFSSSSLLMQSSSLEQILLILKAKE